MESGGISYDDAHFTGTVPGYVPVATSSSLASKLVQNGIAKDSKQAHMFMLAGVLGLIILSIALFYFSNNNSTAQKNLELMQKAQKVDQLQYANVR